jgi:hypothetical protein
MCRPLPLWKENPDTLDLIEATESRNRIVTDGGHGILPIGGHQYSPRAAANSPHWRPRISPPVLS